MPETQDGGPDDPSHRVSCATEWPGQVVLASLGVSLPLPRFGSRLLRSCVRLAAVETLRTSRLGALLTVLVALASRPDAVAGQAVPEVAGPTPAAVAPPSIDVAAPTAPVEPPSAPVEAQPIVPTAPTPAAVAPPSVDAAAPADIIRYTLERIEIRGNRTSATVIRRFVPLERGELFGVDDPSIERIRWRLMGTGWFNDVKLRLERGSQRGWVVLVIEVEERNTLRISRMVAGLSRVVTSSRDRDDELRPYAGLGVAEGNLFGLGIGVGASLVGSEDQLGLDLRYQDQMLAGSGFGLSGRLFYNDAREFFGRDPIVEIACPKQEVVPGELPEPCDPDVLARRAVVIYDRYGFGFGTGHDISSNFRYEIDWLGEIVDVDAKPRAASTHRGNEIIPIDFHIDDGQSYVSSLHFALVFDRRDDPALPSRGQLGSFEARFASPLLGSTYDFARFDLTLRHWQPLPWGHVVSFGFLAGMAVGRAPFFYQYYAADLSDLLPSRVLELNLDHRRTHNLLDTSIIEYEKAELAGRIDFEYQLPLHRGGGAVRGVDAYAGAGLFLLAERDALRTGVQGYEGFARIPLDLTFDLGVQADTSVGLFKLGFSSLIGFLPDLGQGAP